MIAKPGVLGKKAIVRNHLMFSFPYVHTSIHFLERNTEIRIYRRTWLKFIHLIILIDNPICATVWWHLCKLNTSGEDFKPPPDLHILPFTFQPTRALPTQIHLHVTTLSTVFDKFVFSSVNSLWYYNQHCSKLASLRKKLYKVIWLQLFNRSAIV